MADPILGLEELLEGDPLGYERQNKRNLVIGWLAAGGKVVANNVTAPPGSNTRGQAWILSGSGTGLWAGQSANTIAIALSATPTTASGWFFLVPSHGLKVWVLAGSPTGHLVWNGTAFVAV